MLNNADPGNDLLVPLSPWHPPQNTIAALAPPGSPAKSGLAVGGYRLAPVTIETKRLFDRYANVNQVLASDFGFANNFIWLSRMSGFYLILHDCFCLFSLNGDRLTMLLPPIGPSAQQTTALQACFDIMDHYNPRPGDSQVEYVAHDFAQRILADQRHGDSQWQLQASLPDYIYRTLDLIELRGNAYKTKRSEINRFVRDYPNHQVERFEARHVAGVRKLLSKWLHERLRTVPEDSAVDVLASLELERQGIERALAHYEALELEGLCLLIDGRVEGFTFGERIGPSIGSVLIEKTNFAVSGAAQFLFREFARTLSDCPYINVGDDLGLENLRQVKMSYRPVLFAEKYLLRRSPPTP